MQIPCVYLPGPAPAVSVANKYNLEPDCHRPDITSSHIHTLMKGIFQTFFYINGTAIGDFFSFVWLLILYLFSLLSHLYLLFHQACKRYS